MIIFRDERLDRDLEAPAVNQEWGLDSARLVTVMDSGELLCSVLWASVSLSVKQNEGIKGFPLVPAALNGRPPCIWVTWS